MKECPICRQKVKQLNPRHIKKCFGSNPEYKALYIKHNFPEATKEALTQMYSIEKWSTNMIRDHFSMDLKSVCYLLNYYNIPVRTIKETRSLREYKERFSSTNIQRYGAINPLSKGTSPYKKRNQTVFDRYGCENVFQRLDLFIENWSNSLGKRSKISSLNRKLYEVLDEMKMPYKPEYAIKYRCEDGKDRWKSYDAKIGNLLIEVNGDYWHANPNKYDENAEFIFPKSKVTAKDIWDLDKYKKQIAEQHGYDVLTIWESEFKENIDDVKQRIKDQIDQKGNL